MSQLVERSGNAQAPAALAPLLALAGGHDGDVLTVYVDADPALRGGAQPAWQAPVRVALRRLVRHAHRTGTREDRVALEAHLAELDQELRALLDPRRPGRGRVLFAALDGGAPLRFEVQSPLPSFVALRPQAVLLPLLRVLQDGARAGVAVVARGRIESSEWELGALRPPSTVELDRGDGRRRERATNPAVPQPFPERDRFETAAGARVLAQVRDEGARLAAEADARGWDVVVTDGEPRLLDALADGFALADGVAELVPSTSALRLGAGDASLVVGAAVRAHRAAGHDELVRRLDDSAAATRDPFVLERALEEGRVGHLLLAVPDDGRPADRAESLARRSFATGADVTLVDAVTHDLGPAGAAALLRW